MGQTIDCEHEYNWRAADLNEPRKRLALNEEAWECLDCGPLGYRPDLDRSHIELKAHCILQDFHESGLIYVSNGVMGEVISYGVAKRCRSENRFDQWTILRFILEDPNMADHGEFWQNRAERHLLGGEPIRDDQVGLPF